MRKTVIGLGPQVDPPEKVWEVVNVSIVKKMVFRPKSEVKSDWKMVIVEFLEFSFKPIKLRDIFFLALKERNLAWASQCFPWSCARHYGHFKSTGMSQAVRLSHCFQVKINKKLQIKKLFSFKNLNGVFASFIFMMNDYGYHNRIGMVWDPLWVDGIYTLCLNLESVPSFGWRKQ